MHNQTAATANGSLVANFARVTAPNATTLVITTKKPAANMLYVSNPITGIAIVPEHIWSKQVPHLGSFKNMTFPVVGYGPWVATGYVPNQYATLTANKSFYMGAPKYKTLIIQYFSNSDAAVAALRSGQLDEIDNLTATQYKALKSDKNIGLYPSVSNAWTAIELNPGARTIKGVKFGTGNPALADPRVRQAIELAINKHELVTKIWDGLAVAGSGYLPPAYPQWQWTPPASAAAELRPSQGQPDPHRGRVQDGPERRAHRPEDAQAAGAAPGYPLRRINRRPDGPVPAGVAEGDRYPAQRPVDELHPAQHRAAEGQLGHPVGRLVHRARPDLSAVDPDLRGPAPQPHHHVQTHAPPVVGEQTELSGVPVRCELHSVSEEVNSPPINCQLAAKINDRAQLLL